MASDFSTPESALRSLEQAYVAQDIEAAIAAKNFQYEAYAMLANLKSMPSPEPEIVQKAAHVLELSFRKQMKDKGFPSFAGVRTRVVSTKELAPGLVELKEEVMYSDGYTAYETVHAAKVAEQWGIVVLPSK